VELGSEKLVISHSQVRMEERNVKGENMAEPPVRLMNFVSEQQLEEFKEKRGGRVEDGTVQRDRPLYEILKENKDKQEAEFNERFKHRPPKALDDDETEFLERMEMSKRELEQQLANEEAQQLRDFKAAVASHTINTIVSKDPVPQKSEDLKQADKRTTQARRPLSSLIMIKPQAKKLKMDLEKSSEHVELSKILDGVEKIPAKDGTKKQEVVTSSVDTGLVGLVSYSDESDEDTE